MPSPAPRPHRLAFRRLALLCAALLSCTTLRTPVSTIEPEVDVRGDRPAPQLELWVESNRPLTPAEAEQLRGEARSALEQALEGRSQPERGDELVVIRAQGVTRTRGHRNDQVAATAGLVVGAVVIVAAVIVAIVAGGKSNSGSRGHAPGGFPTASAPRGGGGGPPIGRSAAGLAHGPPRFAAASAPRLPSAAPRVGAVRPFPSAPAPRGYPAVPAPGSAPFPPRRVAGPAVGVDVEVGLWWMIPLGPDPYAEPSYPYDAPPTYLPPPPDAPAPVADRWEEESQELPAQPARLALAPPDPFPIEERGFFDGDRLVLEATVLDRETGEALWAKRISRKADPRDARAVKEAVDALLAEDGWQAPAW